MNQSKVISVNPGVKTAGELNIGFHDRLGRISRCLADPVGKSSRFFKRIINLMFGLNPKVNAQLSWKLLFLRLLCGSLMIVSALAPLSASDITSIHLSAVQIIICALGAAMTAGFLSRPISYAGICWFGYQFVLSAASGTPDMTAGALLMLTASFCVLGPGLFSLDQLMRRSLFAMRRRSRAAKIRRETKRGLSYDEYSRLGRY